MKLQNPFPSRVRELYRDCWRCFICGENGSRTGGLELNHILGRGYACAFNASVLCKRCHEHVGHTREEHIKLFCADFGYLLTIHYSPQEDDYEMLRANPYLVVNDDFQRLFLQVPVDKPANSPMNGI